MAAGESVTVAGINVPGGMLYVGMDLKSAKGHAIEPALIDPQLRIGVAGDAQALSYWPSYSEISPAARARYLLWLADGRVDPTISIGYVFLFFYGLERRLLADPSGNEIAPHEAADIAGEVQRLLGIYGENPSFAHYAKDLFDLARHFAGVPPLNDIRPQFREMRWSTRLALGQLAREGGSLPDALALRWLYEHPESALRTAATRCASEFELLFRRRYARRHGAGLSIRATRNTRHLVYDPASASFGGPVKVPGKVPDVSDDVAALQELRNLADECCNDLDAYSRWLGRHPEGGDTLAAVALLPAEILAEREPAALRALRDWCTTRLGTVDVAVLPAADLLQHWPDASREKLSRSDATTFAQLFSCGGFGFEPDVRFGGSVPVRGDTMVLFRLPPGPHAAVPSPEYGGAVVLLSLAVTIAAADGAVSGEEEAHLRAHLESALDLLPAERVRLAAHLRWLLQSPPKLTGLKKRLETLSLAQRRGIADFLIGVAGADGRLDPGEIKALTKIYPMLGFDPGDVYKHAHAFAVAPTDATRPSLTGETNLASSSTNGIALDAARVQAKIAETAAVSALLGSVFVDEETPAITPPSPAAVPSGNTVRGLDDAHSGLLRALAERSRWDRADIEALAAKWALLPDGALETLNEVSFDVCNEPVCEGDDPVEINEAAMKELLA